MRKFLREKLKHDEDCDEIVTTLLEGGGYEKNFTAMAERKFKRKWWVEYKEAIEKNVYTTERCAMMQEHTNMSGRAWDKLAEVERKNWNEKDSVYTLVEISTGVPGDEPVPLPRKKCTKTLKRAREKFASSINITRITDDGSAVAMYTITMAITRQCVDAGYEWCLNRLVEILFSGDAHGTMKKKKMCHICLKVMGSCEFDNSPSALWGLAHWQGGDDWGSLSTHCSKILDSLRLLVQNGSKIKVTFGSNKTLDVNLDFLLTGDGAFLDACNGGSGYSGGKTRKNCPICCCPASEYGDMDHKLWPAKTESYVNSGAHLPVKGKFRFSCPHEGCSFKCTTKKQQEKEAKRLGKLSKSALADFKRVHCGKQAAQHMLFVMPKPHSVLGDTMHWLMNAVGHHWTHAIAPYIASTPQAVYLCGVLHKKCGVVINLEKVNTSNHIDAARLPTLPGPAACLVARHFDLFLHATHYWDGANINSSATHTRVKNASKAMDGLVAIWNEMKTEMEVNKRGMPSLEERLDKADMIEELTYAWRELYTKAFTGNAAKPYTHIALHFAEAQRRVQFDLVRYSCQSQEHYGKIAKHICRLRTNRQLGVVQRRWKKGRNHTTGDALVLEGEGIGKGYIEQCVEIMAWKQHLNRYFPVRGTDYSRKASNKQIEKEGAGTRNVRKRKILVKADVWAEHHEAMSELCKTT
jgi:hypothetical protein